MRERVGERIPKREREREKQTMSGQEESSAASERGRRREE